MADNQPADDPRLAAAARHALHDEELVAAFAAGDDEADAARATTLIERCTTCSDIARDIEAIVGAARALGDATTAAATVKAPRDFRIRPEDVGLARPGLAGRVAAFLGGLASFGRPVGATLATFGLVGLLVGTVSLSPIVAIPAYGPGDAASLAPGAEAEPGAGGQLPAATEDDGRTDIQVEPEESGKRQTDLGFGTLSTPDPGASNTLWLFAGSISLLVLGLAFLWAGSRRHRSAASGDRS